MSWQKGRVHLSGSGGGKPAPGANGAALGSMYIAPNGDAELGMHTNPAYESHDLNDTLDSVYASPLDLPNVAPRTRAGTATRDYVVMTNPHTGETSSDTDGFGFQQPAAGPPLKPRGPLAPPLPPPDSPEPARRMTLFSNASTMLGRLVGRHASVSSSTPMPSSSDGSGGGGSTASHTAVNINSKRGASGKGSRLAGVKRMHIALFCLAGLALLLAIVALGMAAKKETAPPQKETASAVASKTDMLESEMLGLSNALAAVQTGAELVYRDASKPLLFGAEGAAAGNLVGTLSSALPTGFRRQLASINARTVHWLRDEFALVSTTTGYLYIYNAALDKIVDSEHRSGYYRFYYHSVAVAGDKESVAVSFSSQPVSYYSTQYFHTMLFPIVYTSSGPRFGSQVINYQTTSYDYTGTSNAIALSDDSTVLVVGTSSGVLCRWTRTGSSTWPSSPYCWSTGNSNNNMASLAISKDKRRYLFGTQGTSQGSSDLRLHLVDADSRQTVWSLPEFTLPAQPYVYSAAFAHNGDVVLMCDGSNVFARSAVDGSSLWSTSSYDCEALQVLPNNDTRVLAYEDNYPLRILSVLDGAVLSTIGVADKPVTMSSQTYAFHSVAIRSDGAILTASNPLYLFVPLSEAGWS